MQCVKNEMALEHAIAYQAMKATHMKVVAMNVNCIPIVHPVLPAFKTNALIHVLAHVAFMRYVTLKITYPFVLALQEQLVIHFYNAKNFHLLQRQELIHAILHLVVQIVSVVKLTTKLFVLALKRISELHLIVDLNALLIANVLLTKLASTKNVKTHVQIHVESMHNAL